jgi:hypothetical protein
MAGVALFAAAGPNLTGTGQENNQKMTGEKHETKDVFGRSGVGIWIMAEGSMSMQGN